MDIEKFLFEVHIFKVYLSADRLDGRTIVLWLLQLHLFCWNCNTVHNNKNNNNTNNSISNKRDIKEKQQHCITTKQQHGHNLVKLTTSNNIGQIHGRWMRTSDLLLLVLELLMLLLLMLLLLQSRYVQRVTKFVNDSIWRKRNVSAVKMKWRLKERSFMANVRPSIRLSDCSSIHSSGMGSVRLFVFPMNYWQRWRPFSQANNPKNWASVQRSRKSLSCYKVEIVVGGGGK